MKLPEISFDWSAFDGATIRIEHRVTTGTNEFNEPQFTTSVVYSGGANIFDKQAAILNARSAEMMSEMVQVIIDPPNLPTVAVGDRVTVLNPQDGSVTHAYLVQHSHLWDMVPMSLELTCKLEKAW
jgi:hypothetical protein